MKTSNRILFSIVLIGIGLAAGYYSPVWMPKLGLSGSMPGAASEPAPTSKPPSTPAAQQIPVEAAIVELVPFPKGLGAIGSLRSAESVVISAEVAGRVAKINFVEGQPVKKGDVLVELDDSVAKAELGQAAANLELAKSRYERSQRLQASGFVSKEAREDASIALKLQESAYELAKARLDKTKIVAPFDGIVGLRSVSVGEYLNAGQDIAPLEAIDVLKADFRLPERHIGSIQLGQKLDVNVDAFPSKSFVGEVYAISPVVEAGGRSVLIRANVDNKERLLYPGMFVRVQVLTEDGQALVVPETSLAPSGKSQYVYRVKDNRVEQVPVQLGTRRGGMVEIVSGLQQGDLVAVSGLQRLRNNAPVKLIDDPKPTTKVVEEAALKTQVVTGNPS